MPPANHIVVADIVVGALELLDNSGPFEEFQQRGNQFAVQHGPQLAQAHIVQILLAHPCTRRNVGHDVFVECVVPKPISAKPVVGNLEK